VLQQFISFILLIYFLGYLLRLSKSVGIRCTVGMADRAKFPYLCIWSVWRCLIQVWIFCLEPRSARFQTKNSYPQSALPSVRVVWQS